MLQAKPAEPTTPTPAARTAAPAPAPGALPAPVRADVADLRPRPAVAAGDGDPLGAVLARAVARRAEPAGALLQRLPSANNDPTGQADGLYEDRAETAVVCGKTVPTRITAIMRNPGLGTVPSIAPPGWDWLELHVERLKGHWVRFHIINRLLGGSGRSSLNLVPTSVAVNNAFSRGVETDAKANAKPANPLAAQWTYIDVLLTYDGGWPAPIPKRIEAEQGVWDASAGGWVALTQQHPALLNFDITQLAGGPIYLRGDNITAKQIELRGAPASQAGAFARWLRTYSQTNDSDIRFAHNADAAGFDSDWLTQIWLDEDEAAPGSYTPVVKKLQPRPTKKKQKPGIPNKVVGIKKSTKMRDAKQKRPRKVAKKRGR